MPKVVFDTNILISSLIKNGKPRLLWNLVTIGKIHLVLSKQILEEFVEVAAREKLRKYVTENDIRIFLESIKEIASFVRVRHKFKAIKEDPDDDIILDTAYDGKVDYIVSGDKHLLDLEEFKGMKIVTASKMLEIIGKNK